MDGFYRKGSAIFYLQRLINMKHSVPYGFYLGVALMISYIFYYFIDPISMFKYFSKATIWEGLLLVGFIFIAIFNNRNLVLDSGTAFKIALVTLVIGLSVSSIFRHVFSNMLAEELNPIYLEASKADIYASGDLFNSDPLQTLEKAELEDDKIDEGFNLFDYLSGAFVGLIGFCMPFAAIVSFLSRQVLKFRKT